MSTKDLKKDEGTRKIRVVLDIEYDNKPFSGFLDDEELPIKTDEEILNALTIEESEIVDGFEIFPNFRNVDESSVFYLSGATIVSKKII